MAFLLLAGAPAGAQEALRMSLTSAGAAEARQRSATTEGYYNLKLGQTAWRVNASLAVECTDNAEYRSDSNGDVILRPGAAVQMHCPVTDRNSLDLKVGGGYSYYLIDPTLSRYHIDPGTEISFDFNIHNILINLHDRMSVQTDGYQDPSYAGRGNYALFENAAGLSALWDLNKVLLRGGYDHLNYMSLESSSSRPDAQTDVFSVSVGYLFRPELTGGLELGAGLINYSGTNFLLYRSAKQWNAGVFCEAKATDYLSIRANTGYTVYSPEQALLPMLAEDLSGLYLALSLTHRISRLANYSVNAGRSVNFSYYSGTVDQYYARLVINWRFLRKIGLHTGFDFTHGTRVEQAAEIYDQFGPSLGLSRPITEKLGASLTYRYYQRLSNRPARTYQANILTLGVTYKF